MKFKSILFSLSIVWILLLVAITFWWGYLLIKLDNLLTTHELDWAGKGPGQITYMIKWESITLLTLFAILSATLLYFYRQDLLRYQSLQRFFSSLTHELKTPLTIIQLQAEFISQILNKEIELPQSEKIRKQFKKLESGVVKMETELNKVLQLSQIEVGKKIHKSPIDLKRFLIKYQEQYQELQPHPKINLDINTDASDAMADSMALEVIFNNLLQNTVKHNPSVNEVVICVRSHPKRPVLLITYQEKILSELSSDIKQWKKIFYKDKDKGGSGIGLYLVDQLIQLMGGKFAVSADHNLKLVFTIELQKASS